MAVVRLNETIETQKGGGWNLRFGVQTLMGGGGGGVQI